MAAMSKIRPFRNDDLEQLMEIWLQGNLQAHPFVPSSYWKKNYGLVAKMLPQATLWVCEDGGRIVGFVGLTGTYIAGIFVCSEYRSTGIGEGLLSHLKISNAELTLNVYKKNHRAVDFYLRNGFKVQAEQLDEHTGEEEYVMHWAS